MYNCKCKQTCPNVLTASSVTISGSQLLFDVPNTISPVNNGRYIFKCPVSILPTAGTTTIYQCYINLNDTPIPLQCVLGNYVYSDQIRCFNTDSCCNIVLRLAYGSTPAHFKIISQSLCCSNAYSTIVEAAATSTTTDSSSTTTTKTVVTTKKVTTQVVNE